MPLPIDRGISMPFRITPGVGDVAGAILDELRKVRAETILGTRASGGPDTGELAWDPERGAKLDLLRNSAASSAVGDVAAVYVGEAFRQIPGERLHEVTVTIDEETIAIDVVSGPLADASPAARTITAKTTITR